jgi:DDE superfamily endonuclease
MEQILTIYKRPYDPAQPVVCFDESNKQQIEEVKDPLPVQPGIVCRYESEYKRNGTSNLMMFFEPLAGKRQVKVTDTRTARDWALCMKELVDEHYPDVERITIVMDNLNTHTPASLYKVFEPWEAKRIADKLDIQYTPVHGSWLNMAEIELSALSRQCLNRRIPDGETMKREVESWQRERNRSKTICDWQFTTEDARVKLKKLYPNLIKNK